MLGRQAQNDFDRAVGRMDPQGALAKVASQMDSLNTPFVRLIFLAASCEAFGIDVLIYFDYLCQQQFQNSVVPAIQNFFQRPYGYQNTQSLGLIMNFLHFYFLECSCHLVEISLFGLAFEKTPTSPQKRVISYCFSLSAILCSKLLS